MSTGAISASAALTSARGPATRIFVLGTGGFARELRAYLLRLYPGIVVDLVAHKEEAGVISLADYERAASEAPHAVSYLGSGYVEIKQRMQGELRGPLGPPVILNANLWTEQVGCGSVIADGAVIGPAAIIGESVLINYSASVGHDTRIGDLSVVAPHAAVGGFCVIEDNVYVGAGALIRERLRIGTGATVGMGAIVTRDVPAGAIVVNVNEVFSIAEWKARAAARRRRATE